MSSALKVTLTMEKKDFSSNAESARLDLVRLQGATRNAAATLAELRKEARAAGDGISTDLTAKIKVAEDAFKSLRAQRNTAATDYKIFREAAPEPEPNPKGEHGSDRAGNQEAGHSIRSIMDMLSAGTDPARAFSAELPRLLQAAGKGVGTMIGIEAGVMLVQSIVGAFERARAERKEFAEAIGAPTGTKTSTTQGLAQQIEKIVVERDKLNPEGPSLSLIDIAVRKAKNLIRAAKGEKSVEDEIDDKIVALEERRIGLSKEIAVRKKEEVELAKASFSLGEESVAQERIRLSIRDQINALMEKTNIDEGARSKMIDSLKEQERLEKSIAEIASQRHAAERNLRREETSIHDPAMRGAGGDTRMDVPPEMAYDRDAQRLKAIRSTRTAEEASVRRQGGDPRDAHQGVLDAESALRDRLVDDEMKSPKQRAAERRKQLRRDQAEARLLQRTKTHAEVERANDTHGQFDAYFHPASTHAREIAAGVGNAAPKGMSGHEALKSGIDGTNQRLDRLIGNCTFKGKGG